MSGSLRLRNPLHRDLAVFVVLVAALAVVVELFTQQVLLPTLAAEGLVHALAAEAASLFGSDSALQAGIVGFWAGVVVLWAADTYKRPLTIFPLLLGPLWASSVGLSLASLRALASLEQLGIAVIFLLTTVQIGGIGVVQYLRGGRLLAGPPNEPVELRNGPRLVLLTVSGFVALVVVDHHLTLTMAGAASANATFWNAAYAAAIGGLLYPFVRYDNRQRIVQIGPGRSGKTSTVGGMYCDIKEGSGAPGENRTGRQLVTEQLRGISDRLTNSRSFPERTEKTGEIPFDYFDSRRLFRRKNVVMTFDYEGQQLTGENGPRESFSAKLRTYRDRQREAGLLSRARSWLRRVLGLDTGPWYSEFTSGPGEPDIAELLDSANTVLFTLPLDDFLTPSFEREGEIPENAGIYLVEPIADDDEERYLVRRPWGEEFELYRSASGELRRERDDETVEGLDFDSFEELSLAPGGASTERRYTTDKDRAPITSYLDEYRRLIDLLWESDSRGGFDSSCEFVWVATMSDLVYDDFTDLYGELTTRSTGPDEATGNLQFLWENGLFDTTGEPERSRQDYTLFGQWIVDQCIQRHILRSRESSRLEDGEALPDVDELIGRTGEQSVYPVWFDVARPDDTLVIEDGNGRLLKGSNFLFERIEGRTLPYPTFPRFKSPKLRVAYQWMNPFTDPTGKPFYASAVEELERCANYSRAGDGDGGADSSTD